jgi:hypothetical protein
LHKPFDVAVCRTVRRRRLESGKTWLPVFVVLCTCASCGGLLQDGDDTSSQDSGVVRDALVAGPEAGARDVVGDGRDLKAGADVAEERHDDAGSLPDAMSGDDAGDACPNGIATGDAADCEISASSYDTSCEKDSDCARIAVGDFCGPRCLCGNGPFGAINATALDRFRADVLCTAVGRAPPCPCPIGVAPPPATCMNGQCVAPD